MEIYYVLLFWYSLSCFNSCKDSSSYEDVLQSGINIKYLSDELMRSQNSFWCSQLNREIHKCWISLPPYIFILCHRTEVYIFPQDPCTGQKANHSPLPTTKVLIIVYDQSKSNESTAISLFKLKLKKKATMS